MTVLIAGIVLSLVGIVIIPTYEADAKECNNGDRKTNDNNNNKNNNGNEDAADSMTCTNKKDSNDHENSDTAKGTTPFLLPFP